jgi:DNA uptake protein ComE-like DNA-binding protein
MKKRILVCTCTLGLFALAGCSPSQSNPDQIRHDAAKATVEAKRDAKAVVDGVRDGLKTKGAININTASQADLETLPGVDGARARGIIDGRPYKDANDLLRRRIISKDEYDRIANQITAQ